jgi:hypothetical protein
MLANIITFAIGRIVLVFGRQNPERFSVLHASVILLSRFRRVSDINQYHRIHAIALLNF